MDLAEIQKQAKQAVSEIVEASGIKAGAMGAAGATVRSVGGAAGRALIPAEPLQNRERGLQPSIPALAKTAENRHFF